MFPFLRKYVKTKWKSVKSSTPTVNFLSLFCIAVYLGTVKRYEYYSLSNRILFLFSCSLSNILYIPQYMTWMNTKFNWIVPLFCPVSTELQNRANRANQLVLFFLAGANIWEKHAKNRRKHAKTGENTRKQAKTRKNRRKTGAFLVLIFLGEKLVSANFYAFCNYVWHAWWYFVVNLLTEVAPWEFSKNQGSISSLLLGLAQGLVVLCWNKNLQQCQKFCKGQPWPRKICRASRWRWWRRLSDKELSGRKCCSGRSPTEIQPDHIEHVDDLKMLGQPIGCW